MLHKEEEFITVSYLTLGPEKFDPEKKGTIREELSTAVVKRMSMNDFIASHCFKLFSLDVPDKNIIRATISGVWQGREQILVIENILDEFSGACCDLLMDVFEKENLLTQITVQCQFLGPEIINPDTRVCTREVLHERATRTITKYDFENEYETIESEFRPYANILRVKISGFWHEKENTEVFEGSVDEIEEHCYELINDNIAPTAKLRSSFNSSIEKNNNIPTMELDRLKEVVTEQGVLIASQNETINELMEKLKELTRACEKLRESMAAQGRRSPSADPRKFAGNRSSGSHDDSGDDNFFSFSAKKK